MLKRIPEVFDCWFESGAMPFAQSHYPFSTNEEQFAKKFPANFIAEGLDQTRGWFYTLMVISTAIKGCAPFENLIVNGIVLAEDGSKMSKSKKNFPDPQIIADNYGADACRLYLCNSPVVRAEPLKFSQEGVRNVVRDIFLPWFNAYRFLIQNITRWETRSGKSFVFDPTLKYKLLADPNSNFTDNWIIAANQNLIKFVRHEMDTYKLFNVVRPTLDFLEDLTNWYVRLNRPRMKGDDNSAEDQFNSLNTLYDVLLNATILMSPITPFLSEHIFQNMKNGLAENSPLNCQSIHFVQMPDYDPKLINEKIEQTVKRMQAAIETGRLIRDTKQISMKYPLARVVLVDADKSALDDYRLLAKYIKEELNCLEIELQSNEDDYIVYTAEGENRAMGQAFGKKFDKSVKEKIMALTSDEIRTYLATG
jgi:isoleucyl-tRNA synthetase